MGIGTQKLENPAMRRYYGLDDNISGKLVDKIVYNSSMKSVLKEGDILTAIDGHNIENDGTIAFRKHEFTDYNYYVDAHQIGEKITLDIIRNTKPMQVQGMLKNRADDVYLVKTTRYDEMPSYFIYGGYVFSPLTRNLIRSTKRNRLRMSCLASKWQEDEQDEVVVLLKVLASDISRGDNNFGMWAIDTVNGQTFKNFKEFYGLMENVKEKYILLEDKDGVKVIIDKKEALAKQDELLKRYNIEYDRSEDLRK
jgi:hypothetical protein